MSPEPAGAEPPATAAGAAGAGLWQGLALALAGLLVAALLGELLLRATGYETPRLLPPTIRSEYRIAPGASFEYRGFLPGTFEDFANEVTLNRFGFHAPDVAETRPHPQTHRVLVLGDSYVAAFEVPTAAAFPQLVQARLREQDPLQLGSYQWLAFGQGNRAQQAQLEWLQQYGPRYRPDAVLLVFFAGNDVMENSEVLFTRAQRFGERYVREVVPRKQAFFDAVLPAPFSRLNGLFAEVATTLYAANLHRFDAALSETALTSPELGLYQQPVKPAWSRALSRTAQLLTQLRDEARAQRARFLVAGLAGPQAVGDVGLARMWGGDVDWAAPMRWLQDWGAQAGVPVLDLTPALLQAGRRNVYWRHDAHLTPVGHDVVAEQLYGFLYGAGGELSPESPLPRPEMGSETALPR